MNKVILIGNCATEPEIKTNDNGRIAVFNLATTERWKDKAGQKKEKSEFHRVVIFNDGLCGVVQQYVHKGDKVAIEGALQHRSWDDNGTTKYTTEVVLKAFGGNLEMLGSPPSKRQQQTNQQQQGQRRSQRHASPYEPL